MVSHDQSRQDKRYSSKTVLTSDGHEYDIEQLDGKQQTNKMWKKEIAQPSFFGK